MDLHHFMTPTMTARRALLAALLTMPALAIGCRGASYVDRDDRVAIADSLRALITRAYDFSSPDATSRLLSLYPDSGRVISAAAGRVTTSRTALQAEITSFWQRVGRNMQEPSFVLGSSYVDVLSRDAAVMTFTYDIPHRTPAGLPHTVGGAWTALWRRQGARWVIVQEHLSDAPAAADHTVDSSAAPDDTAHRHPPRY